MLSNDFESLSERFRMISTLLRLKALSILFEAILSVRSFLIPISNIFNICQPISIFGLAFSEPWAYIHVGALGFLECIFQKAFEDVWFECFSNDFNALSSCRAFS